MVVGNINYRYAPKSYLRHRVGLECHEDVMDALGIVFRKPSDVVGLLDIVRGAGVKKVALEVRYKKPD